MGKFAKARRVRLLISVGSAVAAGVTPVAIQAADTTVAPIPPDPLAADTAVHGWDIVDAVLNNVGAVTATITNTAGGVGQEATPTGTSSITVDGNDLHGIAIGNNFANTISPFGSIANGDEGDGAGSLGLELNIGPVPITSEVHDNEISADLDDFENGSVGVVNNHIDSDATGNAGSTLLSGPIPNGYASPAGGTSTLTNGILSSDWLDAAGSLVASTIQVQTDPQVYADAYTNSGNNIFLDLVSFAGNTVVGNPLVTGNRITSTAKGNSSNSTIGIEGGEAPAFNGSAVVTNGQRNTDDIGDNYIEADTSGAIHSNIRADDVSADTNTLAGSLKVDGNTVSASATGNEALGDGVAGNRILLGDGMSFEGAGSTGAAVDTAYDNLTLTSSVAADLAINSSQTNLGPDDFTRMTIFANNFAPTITASVQAIEAGSVSLSNNQALASAVGNAASSSFETGDGIASFDGSVALANQQTNTFTDNTALIVIGTIEADVTYPDQPALYASSVTVDGNKISAAASGNQESQNLSLEAAAVSFPPGGVALTGGTGPDGNVHTDGGATVTNLQSIYSGNVNAYQNAGLVKVQVDADVVSDSSLELAGNAQEAIVLGNTGSNGLALTSTAGATGAGIASVQIVADDSSLTATNLGTHVISANQITGSDLETSGNLDRAIAYGASVANTLGVEAETITVDAAIDGRGSQVYFNDPAPFGFVLDNNPAVAPRVDAAYGVLNIQSVSANITAETTSEEGSAMIVTVSGADGGSSITNKDNAIVGAAYGTNSTNKAGIDVGNLVTSDGNFATVLNLTNAQTVSGFSNITAEASGAMAVFTNVAAYETSTSSISTLDNLVQALAYGNLSDNEVAVTATNIDTEADSFPLGTRGEAFSGGNPFTDASFGLNNVQSAGGEITATLLTDVDAPIATNVLTNLVAALTDSSVASDGNMLSAGATGSRANNSVDIDGNELATTAALTNFQHSEADISALIGIAGDDGAPNEGGVSVAINGDIEESSISVDGNTIAGSVTGNNATNSVKASGTDVADGSDHFATWGTTVATDSTALGDYMLSSLQLVRNNELTSTVYGTFSIDVPDSIDIGGATMSVDGNDQSSRAVANTAANSVELDATNTAAGAVLVANQEGWADLSATSNLDIVAPGAATGSSLSMSNNSNLALAVMNNATNTLKVAATNVSPVTFARDALLDADSDEVAAGDHILLNHQVVTTSVTADAVTSIGNGDNLPQEDSIDLTSVAIAGNSTTAEASANRAFNTLTASASASLEASAGLFNRQTSSATVASSAATSAGITLNGNDPVVGALNLGSIVLGDNTTDSLARGNMATNVLNYAAGANYGAESFVPAASVSIASSGGPDAVANARADLLNVQDNNGSVSATSTETSYLVVLNTTPDMQTIIGSTIGVIGNSVSATAYGNTASNLLTVAALNTNMPTAAMGNYQANGAAVTATVTTVQYGIQAGLGEIAGSALAVTGNSITATAIGNTAASVIAAGH